MSVKRHWIFTRRWLIVPPVLIGIAAVVLFHWSRNELGRVPPKEREWPVRVIRAQRVPVSATAIGYGTAKPARVWTAVVEVSGTILKTHSRLRSGIRVQAGDLLVQIDDRDYQLIVKQRAAEVATAEAGMSELLAEKAANSASLKIETELIQVTRREFARLKQLVDDRATSRSELDRAEAELLRQEQAAQRLRNSLSTLPSRIEAAAASIELAQAKRSEAERDVDRTTILAPFDGVLSGVATEPQQVVSQGTQLFELHDTDVIEVEAEFSPAQILPLMSGFSGGDPSDTESALVTAIDAGFLSARVTARSGQAEVTWGAKPLRLSESIDPITRTMGIVLAVDNTKRSAQPRFDGRPFAPTAAERERQSVEPSDSSSGIRLHPGLFCEITLSADSGEASVLVPTTAVDRNAVYVIDDQRRLRRREVILSFSIGDHVVVDQGLDEGELIVIQPPMPVIDGMRVRPEILPSTLGGPVATLPTETRQ